MVEPGRRAERLRAVALAVAVLGVALSLRVWGLGWGLPNELHDHSYHPDEWQVALGGLRMVATGDLNPHFFNYPTLSLYLTALLDRVAMLALGDLPLSPLCYLLPRLLSVLFGVGTVALTGWLGLLLLGRWRGWAAAWLLALSPLAVVNSHYATVDTALGFWCALALVAAVKLSTEPARQTRWLLVGAVAAGLAASTKYNGILAVAPLWVALIAPAASPEPAPSRSTRWVAGVAVLAVAGMTFVLTSPYALIDPQAWPAIRFELFEHPRATNLFNGLGPGWWFHLRWNLPTATGWCYGVAGLLGAGLLARRRAAWPVLAWLLVIAFSLCRTRELYLRYLIPLLPALALAAAAVLPQWSDRPARAVGLLLILAVGPGLRSRAVVAMLARTEARDEAARWCLREIPEDATVGELGVAGQLWYWSVPLRANNGGARTAGLQSGRDRYRLKLNPDEWSADPPEWLVVNQTQVQQQYRGSPEAWARLTAGYEVVTGFENRATVLGRWALSSEGSPLHDWLYPFPRVEVLRRRAGQSQ